MIAVYTLFEKDLFVVQLIVAVLGTEVQFFYRYNIEALFTEPYCVSSLINVTVKIQCLVPVKSYYKTRKNFINFDDLLLRKNQKDFLCFLLQFQPNAWVGIIFKFADMLFIKKSQLGLSMENPLLT